MTGTKGLQALTRRLDNTTNKKVFWAESDVPQLARIYGVEVEKALAIWRKSASSARSLSKSVGGPVGLITKSATPAVKSDSNVPARWDFTASDNKVDKDRDLVFVDGINLDAYRLNPVWHRDHDFSKPIGRSASIEKRGGKLVGVLELGLGLYPDADFVGKALAAKMLSGCSIGFMPTRFKFNEERDGFDFFEVSLWEISSCALPANNGSVIHGPTKSLREQADEYLKVAKADLAAIAKAKVLADAEAYLARTTPEQRRRERMATLLRIKAGGSDE